jgi:hypothetical protein
MRVHASVDAVRLLREWARDADARLARSAAQNAATSVNAVRTRESDDARTLRELERIPAAGAQESTVETRHASANR